MPWLYHPYVGHDNNRDWFMLTQKETQAVSRAVYHEWLPQVWLDEHQMGATGPRMFVPPYAEPVDPDIHPLVWRDVNLIGANMAFRLEQARKSGRHLRLRVRRLLAGRHEEHRLVEEHLRPPHRGGLGAVRDARPHRAERAAGWRQGARGVRPADELPEPLARGRVAAARHHGLRADRLRRDPRDLRGTARRLPAQRARAGPRRDRDLLSAGRLPDPRGPERHGRRRPPGRAPRRARRRAEGGPERRRLRPARPAVRPLRERAADRAALPGDEARPRQGHRPAVRRLGLDPAAHDGRHRRAGDAAAGPRAVEGRGADAAARRLGLRPRPRQPRDDTARERRAARRNGPRRPRGGERGRARVARGNGVPRRRGGEGGGREGGSGPVLDPGSRRPRGRRAPARAAGGPLQAVGGVDGRGLDALRPRAVRLRAEDPRQQDGPGGRPEHRSSTSSSCPT